MNCLVIINLDPHFSSFFCNLATKSTNGSYEVCVNDKRFTTITYIRMEYFVDFTPIALHFISAISN